MLDKLFNLSLIVDIIPNNGDVVEPCGGGVSANGDVGINGCGGKPKPGCGCGGPPVVVEPK